MKNAWKAEQLVFRKQKRAISFIFTAMLLRKTEKHAKVNCSALLSLIDLYYIILRLKNSVTFKELTRLTLKLSTKNVY